MEWWEAGITVGGRGPVCRFTWSLSKRGPSSSTPIVRVVTNAATGTSRPSRAASLIFQRSCKGIVLITTHGARFPSGVVHRSLDAANRGGRACPHRFQFAVVFIENRAAWQHGECGDRADCEDGFHGSMTFHFLPRFPVPLRYRMNRVGSREWLSVR